MYKTKIYYISFLLLIVICAIKSRAQSPYIGAIVNDLNWALQTSLSDDFSGVTVDPAKWCVLNNCTGNPPCECYNWGGLSRFTSANVSVGSGVLSLKVSAPTGPPPYNIYTCCYTGGIQSNNESYSYGYLEINADLPGFIDGNGVAHGDKFQPAFWTYHQEFDGNNCIIVHDEIDILEPSGLQYADAKTNVCGVHNETTDYTKCTQPSPPCTYCLYKVEGSVTSSSPLCNSFHKFAAEWNTDRMVYYLDDVPFFVSNDPGNVMDPMKLLIDLQIHANSVIYDFYSGQPFPDSMNVDYFHYYKLRLECTNSLTILI